MKPKSGRTARARPGATSGTRAVAGGAASLAARAAKVSRRTRETRIDARLELDGNGAARTVELQVPDGFFGHMLEALARHARLSLSLRVDGDTHVDLHHTVEDTGIVLGEALADALGDRAGVERFGHAYAPLDEALARAVVDLSGRGAFCWSVPDDLRHLWVTQAFPLTLVADFFEALATRARLTLHLDVLRGRNPHHVAEACFKAVAVALRRAAARVPGETAVPSTKGTLT
jgi:imidazoleglycerol-phosphate dehydratase